MPEGLPNQGSAIAEPQDWYSRQISAISKQLATVLSNQTVILSALNALLAKENQMAKELDDLTAAMATITAAVNTAVTQIQTLTGQLANNPDAPAVEAAVASLNTLATNLQAAIPPTPAAPAKKRGQ